MKILIFRRGLLGDTVVAVPALKCIRAAYPNAEITLVAECPGRAQRTWAEELLQDRGLVDKIIPFRGYNNPSLIGKTQALLSLLPRLLQRHWNLCIHLDIYERTSKEFTLSRFLRVGRTIRAQPRLPVPPAYRDNQNVVDELIGILAPLNISLPAAGQGDITLPRSARELTETEEWIARTPLRSLQSRPWIAVAPWSNMSAKEWPSERFKEVILALQQTLGPVTPIILGGPDDKLRTTNFVKSLGSGISTAGELQAPHLIELLSRCDLYLGIDTGPMHLAAAARLPSVAIFSARDQPGRWDPYGVPRMVLRTSVECQGCMLRDCTMHAKKCVLDIGVTEVTAACQAILSASKQKCR